jgi:pyruvate formate lyase activating enzyme
LFFTGKDVDLKTTGTIFDIRKFSLRDGPGIRTTVFLKGCPLSCVWCHNPESQSFRPEPLLWETRCAGCGACIEICPHGALTPAGADRMPVIDRACCTACGDCLDACPTGAREIAGRTTTVGGVLREVERDQTFYEESGGGVTFSGGEPLAQFGFLLALLRGCKSLELHTAVDTSGMAAWGSFEAIRPYTDLFLYDLKLLDDERHRQFTGVSNRLILENLRLLSSSGARIIVRTPLVPGLNDDTDNLHALGAFCAGLPHLERLDLLAYHPSAEGKYQRLGRDYPLLETAIPSEEHLQTAARLLETYRLSVKIGG